MSVVDDVVHIARGAEAGRRAAWARTYQTEATVRDRQDWEAALLTADLAPHTRLVALVLAVWGDWSTRTVRIGLEDLAPFAGISSRRASAHIKRLMDCGLLTRTKCGGGRGAAVSAYKFTAHLSQGENA